MRFKKKQLILGIFTAIFSILLLVIFINVFLPNPTKRNYRFDIFNPSEKNHRVLILYLPDKKNIAREVAFSYADGIVEYPYQVEITSADNLALTNFSKYDFITFCSIDSIFTRHKWKKIMKIFKGNRNLNFFLINLSDREPKALNLAHFIQPKFKVIKEFVFDLTPKDNKLQQQKIILAAFESIKLTSNK